MSLRSVLRKLLFPNRPNGRDLRSTTHLRVRLRDLRCRYCGEWLWLSGRPFEVDHIYPYSQGGRLYRTWRLWQSNLALSCRSCNRRKGVDYWVPSRSSWWARLVDLLLILLIDQPRFEDFGE